MERETKEFKTAGGRVIVARTYLTGKEMRDIRDCFIGEAEVELNQPNQTKGADKKLPISGIKGAVISKSEDISIEALIVSVDGKTENILETVWNLPVADYDEVVAYINTITNPKKDKSDTSDH